MTFTSVLFPRPEDRVRAARGETPDYFGDLNLDQIVDAVTAGWQEYDLKPFYRHPLMDVDAVHYRHEVFRDLECATLDEDVRSFARRMRQVRASLAQTNKVHYALQKHALLLDAVEAYAGAVGHFAADLSGWRICSRALLAFRRYLTSYVEGISFASLVDEADVLKCNLAEVRYCVCVEAGGFTVAPYGAERDYSAEIAQTFDKFRQGNAKDYRVAFRESVEMNHIEAQILEFVAKLYPELFASLEDYWTRHANFIDDTIADFDREIHFYLAYRDHIAKHTADGLPFCYPRVSNQSKEVSASDAFDLALARKLKDTDRPIVSNDFHLTGQERIIVVSGPNQGGKTTFARMFGQLHHLASLGCPVPARDAQLVLFDELFTHFEREEKVENLRGKLEDDLKRVHAILERVTARSLIVLNEVFTSTTLQDEIFLSRMVMERLINRDLLGVWVTFTDELASFDEHTVSMVSTIVPENPALRTFKVVRQRADGLAYAMAIAEKFRLTYERIKERIPQ